VRKMTGLDWKSDSAATVIHPFRKGNGRIHLNGTSGVNSKTRIEFSIRVFLLAVTQTIPSARLTDIGRQDCPAHATTDLKIGRRDR